MRWNWFRSGAPAAVLNTDLPSGAAGIIDLRGNIRWKKHDGEPASFFKYGLEFTRQDSDAYRTFARMIAMH